VDVLADVLLRVRPEMAGDVVHLDDASRDVLGQSLAVGGRDEHVSGAVPHEHRHRDLVDLEAPRPQHREIVVDPSSDAV
jgi:hypothetical protein